MTYVGDNSFQVWGLRYDGKNSVPFIIGQKVVINGPIYSKFTRYNKATVIIVSITSSLLLQLSIKQVTSIANMYHFGYVTEW